MRPFVDQSARRRRPLQLRLPRIGSVCVLAAALVVPCSLAAQARELTLLDYHVTPPPAWVTRAPSSTSRLAEFTLAPTADGVGEIVVYFFGPQQQPNVDAN